MGSVPIDRLIGVTGLFTGGPDGDAQSVRPPGAEPAAARPVHLLAIMFAAGLRILLDPSPSSGTRRSRPVLTERAKRIALELPAACMGGPALRIPDGLSLVTHLLASLGLLACQRRGLSRGGGRRSSSSSCRSSSSDGPAGPRRRHGGHAECFNNCFA